MIALINNDSQQTGKNTEPFLDGVQKLSIDAPPDFSVAFERNLYGHEAHDGCFAADQHYVKVLKQRIAAADRGEFASNAEVESFFAEHTHSQLQREKPCQK